MAVDFELGQGDTLPIFECQLLQNGSPIPLPGMTTVRFHLRRGNVIVVDAPALIVDRITGIVQYEWVPADTLETGSYKGEWEITFAPGKILTVPRRTKLNIAIYKQAA